jgi:hypothetical protein
MVFETPSYAGHQVVGVSGFKRLGVVEETQRVNEALLEKRIS